MTRLFLKTFLNIFMWIILLANLYMAFDMMFIAQGLFNAVNGVDYTDRYVGVSSIIQILEGGDLWTGSLVLDEVSTYLRDMNTLARNLWGQPFPSFNEVNNFLDWLQQFTDVLVAIATKIASLVVYGWVMVINVIYVILNVLSLFYTIIGFFSGHFSKKLPHTYDNLVMVITPLITSMV